MKVCRNCCQQNEDKALYCRKCGMELKSRDLRKGRLILPFMVFIALFAIFLSECLKKEGKTEIPEGTRETENREEERKFSESESVQNKEEQIYQKKLLEYIIAVTEGLNYEGIEDSHINSMAYYAGGLDEVGYIFKDLDENGTKEMIVVGPEGKMVYDVYTIKEGQVEKVLSSYSERDYYYFCTDFTIANEGSGSVRDHSWSYYTIDRVTGELRLKENVTYNQYEDENNPWRHKTDAGVQVVSEEQAEEVIAAYDCFGDYQPLSEWWKAMASECTLDTWKWMLDNHYMRYKILRMCKVSPEFEEEDKETDEFKREFLWYVFSDGWDGISSEAVERSDKSYGYYQKISAGDIEQKMQEDLGITSWGYKPTDDAKGVFYEDGYYFIPVGEAGVASYCYESCEIGLEDRLKICCSMWDEESINEAGKPEYLGEVVLYMLPSEVSGYGLVFTGKQYAS